MLKKLTLALVVLVVAVPALRAAAAEDVSGKWSGKFIITANGEAHDDVAYAVFKHKGAEFGGTIGPDAGEQWTIQDAKVSDTEQGWKVTFKVVPPDGQGTANIELALVKGHLIGKAKMSSSGGGGDVFTADVDLERVK